MKRSMSVLAALACLAVFAGCSSSTKGTQRHDYAKMPDKRTYESELPAVWRAVQKVTESMPIAKRTSGNATHQELSTDWIVEESRDKYFRYTVNGLPRQQALKTRVKYDITVDQVIGGTEVKIKTTEEIETLKQDGTHDGFKSVDSNEIDYSRPTEILDKTYTTLLSQS